MSLEQELRDTLGDDRRALPAWPDAVERVQAGVKQRRLRRRAVVASVSSVLIIAFAAPVAVWKWTGGTQQVGGPGNDVAPWLDSPVPAPDNLARREPRPEQNRCADKDLARSAWIENGGEADGYRIHTVLVSNASDTRCTMSGSASLSAVDNGQQAAALATQPLRPVSGPALQYPATIDPGEPARIDVGQPIDCGAGTPTGQPRTYSDVNLMVDGKGYALKTLSIDVGCPVFIGQWYVQPPLLNAMGTATIQAPGQVRRGETLVYQVSLSGTGLPTQAGACPVYRQTAGGPGAYFRLNCSAATVQQDGPVTFAMQIKISADAAPGKATLEWMLIMADGRVVIANLAAGGVPIEILE
jgi:hypothetical protein